MGTALIRGIVRSKLVKPHEMLISGHNLANKKNRMRKYGVHIAAHNATVVQEARTIIIAVKPQNISKVFFDELKPHLRKSQMIISIVTGIDTKMLQKGFGPKVALVRAMPNLPALIDAGISALFCTKTITTKQKRFAHQIFQAVGSTVDIKKEKHLDAITALSGTGPAYLFALIEGLVEAGKKVGLDASLAKQLTIETMQGAAMMVLQTGEDPKKLRDRVTSYKGTTWAAMKVFQKRGFWKTLHLGVAAATHRAAQLRRQKKSA